MLTHRFGSDLVRDEHFVRLGAARRALGGARQVRHSTTPPRRHQAHARGLAGVFRDGRGEGRGSEHGGGQAGRNMAPLLFIFVMQACLETLGDTWPVGKLEFRMNTRTTGVYGGKVSGTDWTKKG